MSLANALRFNYQVCTRKCAKYILLRGQVRAFCASSYNRANYLVNFFLDLAYKTPKKRSSIEKVSLVKVLRLIRKDII
jgi:hypothetical protein